MKSITLEATPREQLGSKNAAQMRRDGFIPCVLYGGSETVHFYAPYIAFKNIVFNPEFFTINISVNGKQYNTLLKEVQFHPVSDKVTHLDFLELAPDKKVSAEIPVKLVGQSPGVKAGGILEQKVRKLKVRALPKDLIEHIEINVDTLELGKSIRIEDLKFDNIEILNPHYMPVASTHLPRVVVETKPEAVATTAAAPAAGAAAPAEGDKKAEPAKGEKKPEGKKPEGKK